MHNDMFNVDKIDPVEANAVINEVSAIVTVSDYVGNVIRNLYPHAHQRSVRSILESILNDFYPEVIQKCKK